MLIHEDAQGGRKMIEGSIFYWLMKPLFIALQKPKKKSPEFTNKYLTNTTRENGHTLAAEYTGWGNPRT